MTTTETASAFARRCYRADHMWDARAAAYENELRLDAIWYKDGYYAAYGYDRHGITYVTVDNDGSDYMERLASDREANEQLLERMVFDE